MRIITVARKPLSEGTLASNVLKHGCGGLNIDASRIGGVGTTRTNGSNAGRPRNTLHGGDFGVTPLNAGRWPANLILQHLDGCRCEGFSDDGNESASDWICAEGCPVKTLDEQSGVSRSAVRVGGVGENLDPAKKSWRFKRAEGGYTDNGGASRFFKQVK